MRPCPLSAAVLCLLLAGPARGITFSSRRGRGLRLVGASSHRINHVSQLQCQAACVEQGGCHGYNYHAGSGTCEVLQVSVCDHHGYDVRGYAGWNWYDSTDLQTETSQRMWNDSLCKTRGYCKDGCERHLGQYCRHAAQCRFLVSGDVHCSSYRCTCEDSHWQFNNTLCLRKNELRTDGRHWTWKALVGGLCATDFDARAADTIQLLISEGYSAHENHYKLTIGQTESGEWVELRRNGVFIDTRPATEAPATAGTTTTTQPSNCTGNSTGSGCTTTTTIPPPPVLSSSSYTSLKVSWCSGQIRFSPYSGQPELAWDDPAPLTPTHLAFRTPGGVRGLWQFRDGLIDPWFAADWSPARIYTIPEDTVLPRRRKPAQSEFSVEFECRSAAGCGWEARSGVTWSTSSVHLHVMRVLLGVNSTENVILHYHRNEWLTKASLSAPDITDAGQFRRFRINITSEEIRVYRGAETEPFLSTQEPTPFNVGYDGPYSPPSSAGDPGQYRLVQYDDQWSSEAGFRWGLLPN